jgi:hypothetical protein
MLTLAGQFQALSSYPGSTTWGSRSVRVSITNIQCEPQEPGESTRRGRFRFPSIIPWQN